MQFKYKLKRAWLWIKTKLLTKEMILPTILGELLFWSPLITVGLLAIIVNAKYWALFASIYTVWVFICPAIPIQLLFIAAFKCLFDILRRRKNNTTINIKQENQNDKTS